jgi:uncharacterized repeat protein (TIGR03803 family)
LVHATNGDLYGTTPWGGIVSSFCQNGACGTIFKMTPNGNLTTLYSFCSQSGCTDGANPEGLVQAASGDLYGATAFGGAYNACAGAAGAPGCGTIFKITPSGVLTTLHNFCAKAACAHGASSYAGLIQGTNGVFYGTTYQGGTYGYGTIYSLSTGQAPFVSTRPTIGKVGETVTIIGYKLTGATSVTFNGVPASFTVDGSTAITTTVPAGATTGKVQVVTPSGTLTSNIAFEVAP